MDWGLPKISPEKCLTIPRKSVLLSLVMNELLAKVIKARANEIRGYVELGWTVEAAVSTVHASSTLGVKSWAEGYEHS